MSLFLSAALQLCTSAFSAADGFQVSPGNRPAFCGIIVDKLLSCANNAALHGNFSPSNTGGLELDFAALLT